MKTKITGVALCLTLLSAGGSIAAESIWAPSKNVEVIVPSGAGGSLDRTGRAIQQLFQNSKLVPQSVVVNRPGGGGGLAITYLQMRPGDAHYLLIGSSTMLASYIAGQNALNFRDLSPIALLLNDYVAFAVAPGSKLQNGKDIVDALRRDPGALSVSIGTSLGGSAHIAFASAMRQAGVDVKKLKVVAFKSGGESISAVLGGHVDVIASSPGNLVKHIQSGNLRPLAISSPQRLKGEFAATPTWKELGVNSTYDNWRGIAGPRSLDGAQIAFWDSVFAQIVRTPDWQSDLERNLWGDEYLGSKDFVKFLANEFGELKSVLTELGLAAR